ncbi:hypothetical protein O181_024499 [Austropuccinia psidii MF-1]|uniref:Uncharacterized protein n=1 Tax=Austropuccinia psidii MF-1 TaxID=1389203 RepID=A0A9Q3CGC9_9BASI|nr:hypothetical protein [Austropuccinia psidii MF-1]
MKSFPKAPKGLPLDFYNPKLLNSKLPSQRKNLADIANVEFLNNPADSLEFKDENKRLGDRSFTNRNWDISTKKSNLDFLVQPESDSDEQSTDAKTSYGESISIEITDQEDNEEKGINEGQEKLQNSKKGK